MKFLSSLFLFLFLFLQGLPLFAVNSPPTAAEYGYVDSDGGPPPGGGLALADRPPVFQWINIETSGTVVIFSGDDVSSLTPRAQGGSGSAIDLGHPFPLFGTYHDALIPASNGYLSGSLRENGSDNTPDCPFPPSAKSWSGGARIAPFHCDLTIGSGAVRYRYFEMSPHPFRPCGVSVFSWDEITIKATGATYSFQALLFDTGDILFQYKTSDPPAPIGAPYSIGIHNADVSESVAYQCSAAAAPENVLNQKAVRFEPYEIFVESPAELAQAVEDIPEGGKIRFVPEGAFDTWDMSVLGGPVVIGKSLTLDGGSGYTTRRSSPPKLASNAFLQLFQISQGAQVLISECELIRGNSTHGGAILSDGGNLKLNCVSLRENRAQTNGGAVASLGANASLSMSFCNVLLNRSTGSGGAVYAEGTVKMHGTTLFSNSAGGASAPAGGGGLSLVNAQSSLTNCTLSGNSASGGTALFLNGGDASLAHCTLFNNTGPNQLYGISSVGASLTVKRCIVAGNPGNYKGTAGAVLTSEGANLEDRNDLGLGETGDLINTDPDLTPAGLHGGRVITHLPRAASPAIDTGGFSSPGSIAETDARGFPRILDSDANGSVRTDIGAVEAGERIVITMLSGTEEVNLPPGLMPLMNAVRDAPDGAHIVFDPSLTGGVIVFTQFYEYEPAKWRHLNINQSFLFFDGSLTAEPVELYQQGNVGSFDPIIHVFFSREGIVSFDSVGLRGKGETPVVNQFNAPAPEFSLTADLVFANGGGMESLTSGSAWLRGFEVGSGGITIGDNPMNTGNPSSDKELRRIAPDVLRLVDITSPSVTVERPSSSNAELAYFKNCEFSGSDGVGLLMGTFFGETIAEDVISRNHAGRGMELWGDFIKVERCSTLNNQGGGLLVRGYDAAVRHSTISGNVLTMPVDAIHPYNNLAPNGGSPEYQAGGAGVEFLVAEGTNAPFDGSMRFEFCTIYNNTYHSIRLLDDCLAHDDPDFDGICNHSTSPDRGTGGILFSTGFEATISNCIVARNRVTFEISPGFEDEAATRPYLDNFGFVSPLVTYDPNHDPDETEWIESLGGNLLDTGELDLYGITSASDMQDTDPQLGPLFHHGGDALCHMPLAVSPAIDAAVSAPENGALDVRGRDRTTDGAANGSVIADIGAIEADHPIVVTTEEDQNNGTNGGVSLREAIADCSEYGRIIFESSLNGGAIQLSATDGGAGEPLEFQSSATIDATSLSRGVSIDGGQAHRCLEIYPNHSIAVHAVSFVDGVEQVDDGGGIANAGDLLLTRSLVSNNESGGNGGGIWNGPGSLTLHNVTITGNEADNGSAISTHPVISGPIEIRHCTIASNKTSQGAGLLFSNAATEVTLASTIIATNVDSSSSKVKNISGSGSVTSLGFNLIDDTGLGSNPKDITEIPALLELEPSDEGGFSKVLLPEGESPAINGGGYPFGSPNLASNRDARGALRQLGHGGQRLDIGAYETYSIDTDGDSLPDRWEVEQALNPGDGGDAMIDGDCDGATHLEEFLNGTDPWDRYGELCDFQPEPVWDFSQSGPNFVTFDLKSLTPPTQPSLVLGVQVESSTDLVNWHPYQSPSPSGVGVQPGSVTIPLPSPRPVSFPQLYLRGRYILDLDDADLNGIDLSGVNFGGIDLSNTDFSGAILDGVDFSGAILNGVNFDGTSLDGAVLYDAVFESLSISFFPGEPTRPVDDSLPEFISMMTMDNFAVGHPGAPGAHVSPHTCILAFTPGTTVAQANAALAAINGKIIGAMPPEDVDEIAVFSVRTDAVDHTAGVNRLAELEADPNVFTVVPEQPFTPLHAPDAGNSRPPEWGGWDPSDLTGGNWGMKYCRAPQLWNFNEAVAKRIIKGDDDRIVRVGVGDTFIYATHPDLRSMEVTSTTPFSLTPGYAREHGTNVAGIIGASHGNRGIEGVNPFVKVFNRSFGVANAGEETMWSTFGLVFSVQRALRRSKTKVINLSLGSFNEQAIAAAGGMTTSQRKWLLDTAELWLLNWKPDRKAYVVNAGGNAGLDASFSTPISYAAMVLGATSVAVTEALGQNLNLYSEPDWASAINGNISAPGSWILTTSSESLYTNFGGTSAASPFVTGSIAYLFSLDPTLTNADIDQLIMENRNPNGTGNGLDAWASAMDIDRLKGNDAVLRMLLDIDDGTTDGNQRMRYTVDLTADQENENPAAPILSPFTENDLDGDGGIGDGRIDMSDYRRARDWAAIASHEGIPAELDGGENHLKHDANRNGVVEAEPEAYFPRNDFNGNSDGSLNESAAPVPGAFGSGDSENHQVRNGTDLEVLLSAWDDEQFSAAEIESLGYHSADLHLALYWFSVWNAQNAGENFETVFVDIQSIDNTFSKQLTLEVPEAPDPTSVDHAISLPAEKEFTVSVCGFSLEDDIRGEALTFTTGQTGRDHYFSPRAFPKLEE